ncbi:zf-TFIIB domain-containing protein [Candidatus Neomarinimicrobiota bacterium]
MKCPKCDIILHKKNNKGIEISECIKCEGIWFNKDELRQIKDKTDSDLNWMDFDIWKHPEKFKAISENNECPSCKSEMLILDYDKTNVEIEYCTNCSGIWIGKNGLKKIIAALENEIITKSMDDYVKATVEEAKDLLIGPESFISEWKDFTTILRFLQYRFLSDHPTIQSAISKFQDNPLNR